MIEFEENLGLINYDNYIVLRYFPTEKDIIINTDDINMDTWEDYFIGIMNIFIDGIEDVVNDNLNLNDGAVYNLQGIQVTDLQPGTIYIKNGKKIIF